MMRQRYLPSLAWVMGTFVCLGTLSAAQENSADGPELTVDEAVAIALANNRPVQASKLDIAKSGWQVLATKTKRLPVLKTELLASGNITSPAFTFKQGVFGTINNTPVPAKDTSIALSSGGITGYAIGTIAQPISQLYQIHLAIREQELSADLSTEKYQQKRQSTAVDVKQAYYAVLQTESALNAQKALIKQYEETDRVAGQYLGQEAILKSESLDVKAQLAQSSQQLTVLEDTLLTQKEHLNDLLGRDLDTPFRTQAVPPASSEELELKQARISALNHRPEIKEAKIDLDKAGYDRKLARAEYLPAIGAEIRYFTPINTQVLPQNILSGGVSMSWDPFEWGKRHDDVKQKDIQIQQSQLQLDQTRSQVLIDVDNTFRKLRESRSLLSVAQAGVEAAQEKLREVNNQFKQSSVLLRDVLKQEASVANANHEYEESLLSFWNARAEFEKALGEE